MKTMANKAILEISDLSICYSSKRGEVHALDNVSLSIEPKQLVAIVGESGCGKTTLGLAVIGLLPMPPARHLNGGVVLKGTNLMDLGESEFRTYRGTEIAMIFQEPMTSLNPVFKIGNQIDEALVIRDSRVNDNRTVQHKSGMTLEKTNQKSAGRTERREEIITALKMVRISDPEHVATRYPFELSGGMRQRVMIAMALAQRPSLLIADEPTTALDVTTQAQVLKLMRNLMQEVDTSIMLITHDLAVASQVADRIAVMYGGQIVEEADALDLFAEPLHPYTQGLLACIPSGSKAKKLQPIHGSAIDLRSLPKGCRFAARCPHVMDKCHLKNPELLTKKNSHKVACFLYE